MMPVILLLLLQLAAFVRAFGPAFVRTPPPIVLYSNNTGLILDCVARGDPPPIIDWVDQNGNILSIHPSFARYYYFFFFFFKVLFFPRVTR